MKHRFAAAQDWSPQEICIVFAFCLVKCTINPFRQWFCCGFGVNTYICCIYPCKMQECAHADIFSKNVKFHRKRIIVAFYLVKCNNHALRRQTIEKWNPIFFVFHFALFLTPYFLGYFFCISNRIFLDTLFSDLFFDLFFWPPFFRPYFLTYFLPKINPILAFLGTVPFLRSSHTSKADCEYWRPSNNLHNVSAICTGLMANKRVGEKDNCSCL